MCDPLVSDCPVEDPTGPTWDQFLDHFRDLPTQDQITTANLELFASSAVFVLYLVLSQFWMTNVYETLMTNYEAISSTNWWNLANMTKNYGGLGVFGVGLLF